MTSQASALQRPKPQNTSELAQQQQQRVRGVENFNLKFTRVR